MGVIDGLRAKAAQDAWALQMRGQMIDIVQETVERLQVAGFAPVLDVADRSALVTVRIDQRAWLLRQLPVPVPVPVVVAAPLADAAALPEAEAMPDTEAVPEAEAAPVVVSISVPEAAPVPMPAPLAGPSAGFVSARVRPMTVHRIAVQLSGDMTADARAAAVATHVQQLGPDGVFDAGADLALCEAVFGGKGGLQIFATDFGIDAQVALARFEVIVAPFRQPGIKALPIDTSGLLLPELRARARAGAAGEVMA